MTAPLTGIEGVEGKRQLREVRGMSDVGAWEGHWVLVPQATRAQCFTPRHLTCLVQLPHLHLPSPSLSIALHFPFIDCQNPPLFLYITGTPWSLSLAMFRNNYDNDAVTL